MTSPAVIVTARLGRDRDGDLVAEPLDGSSLVLHLPGTADEPADRYQIDTGPGPGEPMTATQVRALMASCRLILDAVDEIVPGPLPIPLRHRPVQGPAGLDVDYSPADATRWAAAAVIERALRVAAA